MLEIGIYRNILQVLYDRKCPEMIGCRYSPDGTFRQVGRKYSEYPYECRGCINQYLRSQGIRIDVIDLGCFDKACYAETVDGCGHMCGGCFNKTMNMLIEKYPKLNENEMSFIKHRTEDDEREGSGFIPYSIEEI